MKTTTRALARGLAVGGVALLAAALSVTPAGAASEMTEYSCEFGVGDPEGEGTEGEGTATASFDTGIPDGLVVDVGERVSLDPLTGAITLPDDFVQMLRDAGLSTIQGGGETFLYVDETDDEFFAFFEFAETAVPAEGTMSLDVEGGFEADRFRVADAGVHTILGAEFFLSIDTGEEGPGAGMFCEPADEDPVVDAFEALAVAEPTTTVTTTSTATATAVRPVVVQTDFAPDDAAALPLLGAGAVMTLAAGAVGLARARVRTASRRH